MKPQFPWVDHYSSSTCVIGEVKMDVQQEYRVFANVFISIPGQATNDHGHIGSFESKDEAKVACESWYAHYLCCLAARNKHLVNATLTLEQFQELLERFSAWHLRQVSSSTRTLYQNEIDTQQTKRANFEIEVRKCLETYFEATRLVSDDVLKVVGNGRE